MTRTLIWLVTLAALGGCFALAYWVHGAMQRERAADAAGDRVDAPRRVENQQIKLSAELAESHFLDTQPAEALPWYQLTTVYGRIVPNPRATLEVRSPFAGTLRALPGTAWPAPGTRIKAGQILGRLDVRVGPQERLDLQVKLDEARLKYRGADETLRIKQEALDRLKSLENPRGVPQRDWDDVRVQLIDAQTAFATSKNAVLLWERAAADIENRGDKANSPWSQALTAHADGEVTELAAQPGTAVEAGGLLARIVDFRRPLVRLDVPRELLAEELPTAVELFAVAPTPAGIQGLGKRPESGEQLGARKATLLGPAAHVGASSQFAAYLYEIEAAPEEAKNAVKHSLWRPGLFVKTLVRSANEKQEALAVPVAALLFHQGRALVYVCRADETGGKKRVRVYERREVRLLGRQGDKYLLDVRDPLNDAAGFGIEPGDLVVIRNAQVLLSEEFRADVDD